MNFLLTGSTGFLGKAIHDKLKLSNNVLTLGRGNTQDFSIGDLNDVLYLPALNDYINVVLHVAGLAHIIPKGNDDEFAFDKVNYDGTRNLCKWIETWVHKPETFIFISSVAVYGMDNASNINEESFLLGNSPYAVSKIKAERYLIDWGKKLGINILILRLPLVVGSNPPGNLGKMIKAIKQGTYYSVGGGIVKKSMVLAEDVAKLIADCPAVNGIYNLTDGYHPTFAELESLICQQLNKSKPFNLPLGIAKLLSKIGDFLPVFPINSITIKKITQDLTFSDLKARQDLGWNPSSVLKNWKI
jgi:nucleoside-diphosphate-sugar epimerase